MEHESRTHVTEGSNRPGHVTVTFLSDLGSTSEHVGVVKAVLRELAPDVAVVDLVHDLPPFDVRAASLSLARAVAYLNAGVIIVGVDPGAGGDRRLIGVEVGEGAGVFLGPDNGVLAPAVAITGGAGRAVVLDNERFHQDAPGSTFAVRDVLAPVAAALCNGADLFEVGTPIDVDTLMPGVIPIHREENGGIVSEVIWVDRFGNCQLNISRDDLEQTWGDTVDRVRVTLAGTAGGSSAANATGNVVRNVAIVSSFAELGQGALGLVVDSAGLLCLAVDRGSASSDLGIGESEQVVLSRVGDGAADDTNSERQGSSGTTTSVAPPTARR
ncbi:MAG: S-adenosyl-l-methionine hydroxide adenosyltransferase family protein [Actinomycetota bacterium]